MGRKLVRLTSPMTNFIHALKHSNCIEDIIQRLVVIKEEFQFITNS
jgi:hypothetical protein